MDVISAIKDRRTIRAFKTKPIPADILTAVLEAGRLAPSWANTQSWRWIVVDDPALKNKIADEAPSAGNRAAQSVRTAPVTIAACAELGKAGFRNGQPTTDKGGFWYMFDAGLALENMVLAAESYGLGTVFIGAMDAAKAQTLLGIPEGYCCVILMVLGYPDEQPEARPRKELSEVVFRNKFGAT
jgi:nitroreductase